MFDVLILDTLSVELYEFQIFKSDFRPMMTCMCRISFLTTLDLYKAYFRGCHIRESQGEHMKKGTDALFSLKEATASLRLRVL